VFVVGPTGAVTTDRRRLTPPRRQTHRLDSAAAPCSTTHRPGNHQPRVPAAARPRVVRRPPPWRAPPLASALDASATLRRAARTSVAACHSTRPPRRRRPLSLRQLREDPSDSALVGQGAGLRQDSLYVSSIVGKVFRFASAVAGRRVCRRCLSALTLAQGAARVVRARTVNAPAVSRSHPRTTTPRRLCRRCPRPFSPRSRLVSSAPARRRTLGWRGEVPIHAMRSLSCARASDPRRSVVTASATVARVLPQRLPTQVPGRGT